MPVTAWLRRRSRAAEIAWFAFAAANLGAMLLWPDWETIPFHFVWVSLTLLFGFRLWRPLPTYALLAFVCVTTGVLLVSDAREGAQPWGELFEVPLMTAMFLAMVWHAGRRQHALRTVELLADERASLLGRQERFLHDVSHELRTPITIARGHLEVVERSGPGSRDVVVALDELGRMERIVERLLLLANANGPDFLVRADIELGPFLEDVFLRWSEVAPRAWRLGTVPAGNLRADPELVRDALDALLENAVKYTEPANAIELRAQASNGDAVIEVADDGCGIRADALPHIFERFARADAARSRSNGGAGLGLSIVAAIARAHGGRCDVTSSAGSTFSLRLPGFRPALASAPSAPGVSARGRDDAGAELPPTSA